MTTRRTASNRVCNDRVDGRLDELGRIVDHRVVDAGREVLLQPSIFALTASAVASALEPGALEDDQRRGGLVVEIGIDAYSPARPARRGRYRARALPGRLARHEQRCLQIARARTNVRAS